MRKLAMSYYFDIFRFGSQVVNLKIHESGQEAMKHITSEADGHFEMPVITKNKKILPSKGCYSIGFGFRGFRARFLDAEEVRLIDKYGVEGVWFDHELKRLCEPEAEKEVAK